MSESFSFEEGMSKTEKLLTEQQNPKTELGGAIFSKCFITNMLTPDGSNTPRS